MKQAVTFLGDMERRGIVPTEIKAREATLEAKKMIVQVKSVICPHCGYPQLGWASDPRRCPCDTCEDCGKVYTIPEGIEVMVQQYSNALDKDCAAGR